MPRGFLLSVAFLLTHAANIVGALKEGVPLTALSADDACLAKGGRQCALNALQRQRRAEDLVSMSVSAEGETGTNNGTGQTMATFAGGGFKAMGTYIGTVVSMTHVLGRKLGCNATLADTFKNMDGFASNSGGGWFFSQLAYSSHFQDLLHTGAHDPKVAGKTWAEGWVTSFLNLGKKKGELLMAVENLHEADTRLHEQFMKAGVSLKDLSSILGLTLRELSLSGQFSRETLGVAQALLFARTPCPCEAMALATRGLLTDCPCSSFKAGSTGDEMALHLNSQPLTTMETLKGYALGSVQMMSLTINIAKTSKYSWGNLVEAMLVDGGKLSPYTMLGTQHVNAFAKNRLWLPCTTLMTPGGRGKGMAVTPYQTLKNKVSYTAKSPEGTLFNLYTPVKYSVIMGGGVHQRAPFPICGAENCFGFYNEYTGTTSIPGVTKTRKTKPWANFFNRSLTDPAGLLFLTRVVTTSSAAFGFITLFPTFEFGRIMSPMVADSVHPYDEAKILMARAEGREDSNFGRTLRDFANYNMMSIIDGVLSENTGIMHSVGTGHNEITANVAFGEQNVLKMFSGYYKLSEGQRAGAKMGSQFAGLPNLRIFADQATDIAEKMGAFKNFTIPATSTYLLGIRFGTITTTTVDNHFAGIKGGMPVTLHIALVDNAIGVMGQNSFYAYGIYAQEIVDVLTAESNKELAEEMLAELYTDVAGREAASSCSES